MSKKIGVYFTTKDYAGLFLRFTIIFIDLFVISLFHLLIIYISEYLEMSEINISPFYFFALFAFSTLYLTEIKRRFGTIGYLLTRVRIVNLEGKRPGFFTMLFRYLFWVFGPFYIIVDIFWLCGDVHKQTIRDKIVGTYVVRKNSIPEGSASIVLQNYMLMGFNMKFEEVKRQYDLNCQKEKYMDTTVTQTKRTSGSAIVSLMSSCLSIVLGPFFAIPGIICGHIAINQCKKDQTLHGFGMALAGLIIGYICLALGIFFLFR